MISTHRKLIIGTVLLWLSSILLGQSTFAQQDIAVNWLNFKQLDEVLKAQPKKVFVMFYADWCVHCHKMDRVAFQDKQVAHILNNDYYAVKMDIESTDTILFGNQLFVNKNSKRKKSVHEIPLMMASRKDYIFSVPAIVLLDEHFEAKARYFQYLNTAQMLEVLLP